VAKSSIDTQIRISAHAVATHCVHDPEFALQLLAELAARGIDCVQLADDGYAGSLDQQRIPEFLERMARAIRLVHCMTAVDNVE